MQRHVGINAHLLSSQANYRSAGIHGYIYNTLQALTRQDDSWRYTVMVGDGNPPLHRNLQVRRAALPTRNPLARILWEQVWQPWMLPRLDLDLYHAMAFVTPLYVNVPSVVTVYDLSFIRYPAALSAARRHYLRLFTARSCQQARQVITISESTAQDVQHFFGVPAEKITVAVPGVDARFRPLPSAEVATFRQQKGLPDRFLLHLGTLEPRKNLPLLIEAYAALPASLRQQAHLVLAGGKGWDYAPIFAAVAQHQLGDTVHFPGFVDSADLPLWYNAAEALVYPSLFEGWGLPVVEAMACGCPTIISDVSSLPEAAGETGLRLPPHEVSAWTVALHTAITDDQWRAASSTAGRQRATQFTWQQTAQATVQAYRRALNIE